MSKYYNYLWLFSPRRWHVMTFTRFSGSVVFVYSVNGNSLKTSGNSVMELKSTFDRHLCFHSHIERVTCMALKMLWFVKRTSTDFKLSNSLRLFNVHLCVLTCNVAWYYRVPLVTSKSRACAAEILKICSLWHRQKSVEEVVGGYSYSHKPKTIINNS